MNDDLKHDLKRIGAPLGMGAAAVMWLLFSLFMFGGLCWLAIKLFRGVTGF